MEYQGHDDFAEIQKGLELFECYGAMNYLSRRGQDGGIFNGIDALRKAIIGIDIQQLLSYSSSDGKPDLHLLSNISRLVLAMEQAQTAATCLADRDQDIPQIYYGEYYYKPPIEGTEWITNEDTAQTFKAHERVNDSWMPVLWDIFNLEQNPQNELKALNTLQSLYSHFLTPPSGEDKSAAEEETTFVEQQPPKFLKQIKNFLRDPLGLLPEPEPEPEPESEPESDYSKFLKQFETAQESLGAFGPLFKQFKDVYGESLYNKSRYGYLQYGNVRPLDPDNTEFQDKTREQKITFVLRGIAEIIRSDLVKRYSPKDGKTIPSALEETLKNLCLEKYAKDFETIKDHILSGCSQVSRSLLERLAHIEQWLSSEDAQMSEGGDKERMGLLRSGIAIKRKYLATSCRETALLCLQLMVPPQLGRILGGQDQEGPSQADLRNSLAYLTGLSEQMVHLLEIRKELDQLKTRQAERERFEREFPKAKEELKERLEALIRSADQGSFLVSKNLQEPQGM